MQENFDKILAFTLQHEGVRSNDPGGGDTKYGIARLMHPEISDEQWENWTEQDSIDLYKKGYWDYMKCDDLPYPLDCAVFDCAVNPGPGDAKKWLAQTQDVTLFMALRKKHYLDLVRATPSKAKYLKGWLNRCKDLEAAFPVTT